MSLGLLQAGASVAMIDMAEAKLSGMSNEARSIAGQDRFLAIKADITTETDVARAIDLVNTQFGSVYALVNNAAIGRSTIRPDFLTSPIRLWEITPAQWRRMIDVNVNGFFLMTRAVVPILLRSGKGRVVTVTTSLDTMIRSGSAPYGGSKAAVEAYMAALAEDLRETGVTANVLVPGGPVNTGMIPESSAVNRAKLIQPEVMVPPLVWLLSDASEKVSGRRFVAVKWGQTSSPLDGSAPVAWPQLGAQAIYPGQQGP